MSLPLLIVALQTIFVLLLTGLIHRARKRIGPELLILILSITMVLVQWLSDLGSRIVAGDFVLHIASIVLFPAILLGMFLTFVFDGPVQTRRLLYALLVGVIGYTFVVFCLASSGLLPPYLQLDRAWILNHFYSTLAVIADFYFVTFLWSRFSRDKTLLFPKIFLLFLGVSWLDTSIFVLGAFWGNPAMLAILKANLVIRVMLTILVAPIAYIYLLLELRTNEFHLQSRYAWSLFATPLEVRDELLKAQHKIEDIEKAKKKTEHLALELKKYQMAVEGASDHIIITDTDGIILYANDAVERITGFSREEVVGKKAGSAELWGGLMPNSFYKEMWLTIKQKRLPFTSEVTNKRKSGEQYTAMATISPILDKDGQLAFFIGIERDISKEKQVDRMKTEFVSLVTHQLLTPVTAIKWSLDDLLDQNQGKLNTRQKAALQNALESNTHMSHLIRSLLNISRMESGRMIVKPEPTNLSNLVKTVLKEISSEITENKITIQVAAKYNESCSVDPKLVTEVYKNLLTNAVKYSRPGGKVTVTIDKSGNEIISRVTDSGYGIPEDEVGNIFQKFYRASNVAASVPGGTGLGLYLSKIIVEASGGRIGFESELDKGTTFWFTLPLSGMKAKKGEVTIS